jgi:hypothetical protein
MGTPKQIIFRYNGDPATEEHVADLEGEETIPAQGAVVERKENTGRSLRSTKKRQLRLRRRFPFIGCT